MQYPYTGRGHFTHYEVLQTSRKSGANGLWEDSDIDYKMLIYVDAYSGIHFY